MPLLSDHHPDFFPRFVCQAGPVSITTPALAQNMTGDMGGNMTGDNMTAGNMTPTG